MKVLLAPAKKMNVDTDSLPWRDFPRFLPQTWELLAALRRMKDEDLQALWRCNDAIAALNLKRLAQMNLTGALTPALLSYEGIQYRCMGAGVLTADEYEYAQAHLRILSGFYGLLKPFDGVTPYRLEMQAKLRVGNARDLYAFWGGRLAQALEEETDTILNLASAEYAKAVLPHLSPRTRVVTCVFGQLSGGRIWEKGTLCKMARGDMAHFLAQEKIERPEDIRAFDLRGFRYRPDLSDRDNYVFIQDEKPQPE